MPYYPPPSASGGAPSDATYITQTANGTLSAEQNLAALTTGLMVSTTTTGVVSTVAAPAGTVVGTTDAQTVSGKILSDTFMGKEFDTRLTQQTTTLGASQDYLIDDALENSASYVLELPATSTLEVVPIVKQAEVQSYFGIYDFIESGCIWTADAAGSTLAATMSEGYVWIGGRRLKVNTVKSHAFTASVDTYVDFSDNGNGTAKITYTETANNAATGSPTLPPGSVRNAIVVSGVNIAAATSINQGQETIVLPIVSSIPYQVTDSLGNLICPRDPSRKLLGQRQLVANFSPGTIAETLITGLNCPVIIPTGRKVKISASHISSGSTGIVSHRIYEGIFGSGGTQKQQANETTANGSVPVELVYTPTTSALTYTATIQSTATNPVVNGAAANPAFLKIELE